jgi:S-layer family protein
MKSVRAGAVLATGVVLVLAGTAQAQDALVPTGDVEVLEPSRNWGTTANTIVTHEASDFEIFIGMFGGATPNGARFCGGSANCGWLAGIQLPAGAILTSVELDACDTDVIDQVQVAVFRSAKGGGAVTGLAPFGGTGGPTTPGCAVFVRPLTAPETIDNLTNNYILDVISGRTDTTSFKAVRVNYRLQVSAAPATATFPNDVPTTHPFFRFVEAMAASGLTGGCGAGSFCPDTAVTRGQLAVFLASALGLHFPN